ncbi:cellulose synthase [Mesorhizobium sp. BAC0120]|uniref:cellulose synthase n=1 Tax=Mesorhizobium sp. BAC0120 TaxID=3090670 RepID=UPI00298CEB08|nr:cellulose synthase [Mesorhizobium sp. BAC0120]MDW6023486.1 cellulose synthase [Mesorhizobium sp. BAC0120]
MTPARAILLTILVVSAVGAYWLLGKDNDETVFSSIEDANVGGRESQGSPPTREIDRTQHVEDGLAPEAPRPNLAQAEPRERPPAPVATSSEAGSVDETALRYFARQGDTKRLQAEIARLRALYPNWTPPADPLAAPTQADPRVDVLWTLYSQGKYAQLRSAIADRQTREPNWQPPKDLLDRLAVAEARERLVNASELKQYETVVTIAANSPALLTCSEVDTLWRVAEAFAMTSRPDRAKEAYLYILRNCDNPGERVATVQKAVPLLQRDAIDELLATERPGADGQGEFAKVRPDMVRRSVAAGVAEPPAPVPEADLKALEVLGQNSGLASDALLLGWYYLRHDDAANAQTWFAKARQVEDSAETSQGLALALIALQKPGEAENILYKWQDTSDELRNTYLAAVTNLLAVEPIAPIDPIILQRIVPVVAKAKDAAAAQQLGWYAHAFDQDQTAAKWFSAALQWKADDEPSAYGLAVVRMALGDKQGVAELQRQWASRSERIATIAEPQVKTAATAAARRKAVATVEGGKMVMPEETVQTETSPHNRRGAATQPNLQGCSKTDLYSPATGRVALSRGWCLMEIDRPMEAVAAFEAALQTNSEAVRRDAAWGQSLAYIRAGLANEAAVAAAKTPQSRERALDLEASILSLRATGFFEKKRYAETILALDQRARIAPERLDLMAMRGYAYLSLRRINEARQVFEALAAAGDPQGQRGLAAVRATIDPNPQD